MSLSSIGTVPTIILGLVVALVLLAVVGLIVLNRTQGGRSVGSERLVDGTLAPCPGSPNCVSTQADPNDSVHYVEPIPRSDSVAETMSRVVRMAERDNRMVVVETGDRFVRLTERSVLFGFVDDIDVYFPEQEPVVHMRSASRVGRGDMGVNRKRYQRLRATIQGVSTEGP